MRKAGVIGSLGLVVAAVMLGGCAPPAAPPNVSGIVTNGLDALSCGYGVYTKDTATTPPASWEQIALDLATTCGMDVADIVNAFGASHPVALAATAKQADVHTAAAKRRSGK